MSQRAIKYFSGPTYTDAQWTTRNPLLRPGEVGYVMDENGVTTKSKVGPGRWNNLPWFENDFISGMPTVVGNPIGDAKGNLNGLTWTEALRRALYPYAVPQIQSLQNDGAGLAGAGYAGTKILQVGQTLSGSVKVSFTVANPSNLIAGNSIQVMNNAVFSNTGFFAPVSPITLNVAVPVTVNFVTQITIGVRPIHSQGNGDVVNTYIQFAPQIINGVSPLATLDAAQAASIAQKNTVVTTTYKRDYTFTAPGYAWLFLPSMLVTGQPAPIFTDVTDPNAPAGFGMVSMGTLNINNGVATYPYTAYRSTFYLLPSLSKLRVS
jgi:hypothetical protein